MSFDPIAFAAGLAGQRYTAALDDWAKDRDYTRKRKQRLEEAAFAADPGYAACRHHAETNGDGMEAD